MKKSVLFIIRSLLVCAAVLTCVFTSCSNYIEDSDLVNTLNNELSSNSLLSPVAKIEAPVYMEGGVPKNRRLVISFSKPMNTKTFWEKLIITDSMGKNLKEYL